MIDQWDTTQLLYLGSNTNGLYCWRLRSNPFRVVVGDQADYIKWRKKCGIIPITDTEHRYVVTDADLHAITIALIDVLHPLSSAAAVSDFHKILSTIKERKL